MDVPPDVLLGGGKVGTGAGLKLLGGALVIGLGAVVVGLAVPGGADTDAGEPPKDRVQSHTVSAPVPEARASAPPATREPVLPITATEAPESGEDGERGALQASPSAPRTVAPSASSAAPVSSLRQEMELLSRGQSALRAGDAAGALRAFEEHRRRFPSGALAAERQVKAMVALCQLGRGAEARAEADRFVKRHPGSPLASHALKICREEK